MQTDFPLFPLPLVATPHSRTALQIFEPRYLAMIEDVLKTPHRLIGMIQPRGKKASDRMQAIGCAGRVTQFSETEDGRYMVTLSGVSRYRIGAEVDGFTPYRRFEISWTGFEGDLAKSEKDPGFRRQTFFKLLERYFENRGLSTDWETLKDADDELLINSLSMLLEFESEDKQALLEAPSLMTRRETLITLIEYSMRGGNSDEMLQ